MNDYFISDGFQIAAIILGVLLCYYLFYYLAYSKSLEGIIKKKFAAAETNVALFFSRKLAGFFILGVVPAFFYFVFMNASGDKFGVTFIHLKSSIVVIAGLILMTAIILFFHYKRNPGKSTLELQPAEWSLSWFMLNALGWSLYLIAYEFLFRGILLFECYEALGFWPAVAINVSIYSAIHMVSGKDQTMGALVFGTIACYFALTRGTLLIPFFMHLSLSILSDYYSIKKNQKLKALENNHLNSFAE